MRFKDKVALITAVGSGIGRATATIMANEGAVIVGVDNDERRLDMAMEELNMTGGRAFGRCINALDPAEVDEAVAWAAKNYGIDILVNAVGGSTIIEKPGATVDELTFDEWQRLIHFNLSGTFLFCHAVAPEMKRRRSGKIVNLASIAGRGLSLSSSSAYSAAKGGIIAFTRKLSFELGPFGDQRQRDRAEPHADRAHPAALEPAVAGGSGGGDRAHAAPPYCRGGGPGEGDLLPRFVGCRFRHGAYDRCDGRTVRRHSRGGGTQGCRHSAGVLSASRG